MSIKYVFFRNDDVWSLDAKLKRLVSIFISERVPLHLAVIPGKLTPDCINYLKVLIKEFPGLIEIGQHGYKHKNYSFNKYIKYEFGPARNFKKQLLDIRRGKVRIKEALGIVPRIFVPPWNLCDFQTIQALGQEGFSVLSTDKKHQYNGLPSGLSNICISKYWNKKRGNGSWYTDETSKMLFELLSSCENNIGIEIHHSYNTSRELNELSKLIKVLKRNSSVQFIKLSGGPKEAKRFTLNRQALFYYLMFQFVPRGFSILPGKNNPVPAEFDFFVKSTRIKPSGLEHNLKKEIYRSLALQVENALDNNYGPPGLLLSGGIDSAALLHIIREVTDRKLYTITGHYFPKDKHLSVASKLARHYGTIHKSLLINPSSLNKLKEIYACGINHPIGDNGLLATYLMVKELRSFSGLVFSGDGSDCLFAGLKPIAPAEVFLTETEIQRFFPDIAVQAARDNPLLRLIKNTDINDSIRRQVAINLQFLVKNRVDYLLYAARACSSRIILPYLGKDFVRKALNVPSSLLVKGRQSKYILRKAFEEKLPEYAKVAEKRGFSPPFLYWYTARRALVTETLVRSIKFGIPVDYIKYLLSGLSSCRDYEEGMKIWLVLNFVFWAEQNIRKNV